MIKAYLIGDKVFSNESEAFSLHDKSRFGEKKQSKIEYSLVEILFLMETKKFKLFNSKDKEISKDQFLRKAKRIDKRIQIKMPVFFKLRKAGYLPKTALKFGAEFRVYEKNIKPGQDHAKWICFPVKESEAHTWYDFAAKNRVSHSAKKKLLLAIVDDEDDVTFYEVGWVKV